MGVLPALLWLVACDDGLRLSGRDVDLTAATLSIPGPFVPAACYARTEGPDGQVRNPCWTCHQQPRSPTFVDDRDLQLAFAFPEPLRVDPWRTPIAPVEIDDAALLARIREDNYHDEGGGIALARALADLPPGWDVDGDGSWDGFVPDLALQPDDRGHDRDPDGVPTGWRTYRYTPLPGVFWPTNGGSWGDGWIRLPEPFRSRSDGTADLAVYERNLAILEAAIRRVPVIVGADTVLPAPARSEQRWAGLAGDAQDRGELAPPTAGLFPVGTELLHGLRYLDPTDGQVGPAARLKELRYLRKTAATTYASLAAAAADEARERQAFPERLKQLSGDMERGLYTGTGWRLQGFVEDALGELRPQTFEETASCVGCHGGVGASVDSTFSFARKIAGDAGWGGGDYAVPDLLRADGRGEAELYLETTGSGDDFGTNPERGGGWTGTDLRALIVPSPERALALDRGHLAIVRSQSFVRGRDPAAALDGAWIHDTVGPDRPTGVLQPVTPGWVVPRR